MRAACAEIEALNATPAKATAALRVLIQTSLWSVSDHYSVRVFGCDLIVSDRRPAFN
jgi:hypothetical protein